MLGFLQLRLNEDKTFILDLHREPVIFLGYEIRGGNLYPPKKAIDRLEKKLRVRGHEAGRRLLEGFVDRYRIGPVRKLFRRLDRNLQQHLPMGYTLTGLLDGRCEPKEAQMAGKGHQPPDRFSRRQGCTNATQKALLGRPPQPQRPGAVIPSASLPSAPREVNVIPKQPRMRDSKYLDFIRSRPCSFCGHEKTEPHHVFKRLRGVSEAGLAQKGSDYVAIPVCRRCHDKIHWRTLRPDRAELLEIIAINLICFLDEHRDQIC